MQESRDELIQTLKLRLATIVDVDVTGASVSRYAYEVEFMPQALKPIRITADELGEDIEQIYNDEETEE